MNKEIEIPRDSNRPITKINERGHLQQTPEVTAIAYDSLIKRETEAQQVVERTEELAKRAQEVFDTVDYLLCHIPKQIDEYTGFIKEALGRIRDQKMALQSETRSLMSSFREVREFFLEDKHQEEVRRLVEFVELCERLKRLKDSGFLDTVADTMLRLSEK